VTEPTTTDKAGARTGHRKWTPEAKRAYQREWLRKRRDAWFKDKTCAACGSADDLHLHHRDPAQKVQHRVWSWREDRRLAELAKCDVLCGPCHRAHHQRLDSFPCGTEAAYKKGCRCPLCRWAKQMAREAA
jgi:hypothetical protein